ncbi:putative dehydrogenase/phosphoheptose isomerase [Actinokineospora baliensis]|uniref:Gfo/Idh/MocA family protein n=1 Tax=Actinokineospora baliensis TaxID=547056 RepID=UPI00195C1863|nr:SIS domain-containing protein [Actinokineospora baliensis]MBM7775516.1 putative dehydrogenase/phosphoheptose isomerase [Actinokineospora baliensis]
MNTPLRVAIVGMGSAGRRRADALRALPDLYELVAVCDVRDVVDPPDVPAFTDHRQLLAGGPALDVVLVCTSNEVTRVVVEDALAAGKHVFCEKPAGRSTLETEALARAARGAPGRLAFGFNHRQHGSVRAALALAHGGELGRLIFARGVYGKSELSGWRADPAISGGGILLDQGIHLLDLISRFCGDFSEVQAMVGAPHWSAGADDNVFALLRTDDGVVASLHSSATQWQHTFRLELAFSEGSLVLDGLVTGSRSYRAADGSAETLTVRRNGSTGAEVSRYEYDRDDSWERELAAFAAVLRGGAEQDLCDTDDALAVMRLVGRVYDAALASGDAAVGRAWHADAITSYRARLGRLVTTASWDKLEELSRLCLAAHREGRDIYVAGNGGSAATAAHWATDLRHAFPRARGLRVFALGQNVAFTTAAANDRGYEGAFTEEAQETLNPGDVVIVISASGNSPNILHLLKHADEHGAHTVAVTGFDGGKAAKVAQLTVHTPGSIGDYGPAEDIHLALGHALMERLRELAAQHEGAKSVVTL